MSLHSRGDLYVADLPGYGYRPVLITTRQEAIPVLSQLTVVLVTTRIRGHRAEVALGAEHGLDADSVANCDVIFTIQKARLGRKIGELRIEDLRALDRAFRFAQGLSE